MNFNVFKYELFLKLLHGHSDEVISRFEREDIEIDIYLNKFQWTPLQVAAHQGKAELVSYFLNRGANKDHRNIGGFTAQMLAERKGFCEIASVIQGFILEKTEEINTLEQGIGED